MSQIIWILFRAFLAYLLVGVLLGILILNNQDAPDYFTMSLDVLGWFFSLGLLISFVLLRFEITSNIGKFLLVSLLGTVVLCFYAKESYWLFDTQVRSWTLFLAVLYTVMLLYFIFPFKLLRPLLFLIPVAAGSWALYWLGYTPLNVTVSLLEAKGTLTTEEFSKAVSILPDVYFACLSSALFWLAQTLVLYAFVYWGHTPRSAYLRLYKALKNA